MQLDSLRRAHKASGSEKNFDEVVYPKMQELGKENTQAPSFTLYDKAMEGFESARLSEEDDKRKAEAEQKEKAEALWSEKPGEAAANAVEAGEIEESAEGVAEMARRLNLTGNLEGSG